MSFAATTALVAVFGLMRQLDLPDVPRWLKSIGAVFVSSLVAGLATAPFAAFHFNQIAQFGLIANLLSVPLMGTLVMPAAVVATVLAPLGLEMVGLWVMDLGLRWILGVAHFVADQDAAVRHVATPGPEVLALISLGGVFVVLWSGRLRWLGLAPIITAFAMWQVVERPALLVADTGSLIGVMTQSGRVVSKERGESFAVGNWLENDGAPVEQEIAYGREGLIEQGRTVAAMVGNTRILNLRGSTAVAALNGCGGADIVITNQELDSISGCDVYDIRRLRQTGALAGYVEEGKLTLISVSDQSGGRIWNTAALRRRLFDQ
jgi:competence protein ComEC